MEGGKQGGKQGVPMPHGLCDQREQQTDGRLNAAGCTFCQQLAGLVGQKGNEHQICTNGESEQI